jgi:hypothetical protein
MPRITESIGIQPIHIRISTNMNPNDTIFTRDMIHIPEKQSEREKEITNTISNKQSEEKQDNDALSKYPYFTDAVRFPTATILKLSKQDQIKLFFDKRIFNQKIGYRSNVDQEERNDIAEYNHKALLNILIPTSFPRKSNIHETFSENIKNMSSVSNIDDDVGIFNLLFSGEENKYGYLNMNGRTGTVTKIVLLNDIINDKSFSPFIKTSNIFQLWRKNRIENLKDQIDVLSSKIDTRIKENLPNIKTQLTTRGTDANIAFEQMKDSRRPQNRMANLPESLMIPFINIIINYNGDDNDTIISTFDELYQLKKRAGERESSYIPYQIITLSGFKELLQNSYEISIKNNMIKQLSTLSDLYAYINKNKDVNDEDLSKRQSIKELIQYTELKTFINETKKYTGRNRQYSNKLLTEIFSKIETNMEEFIEFIDFINEIRIEGSKPKEEILNNSIMTDRLKTGVMSVITSSNTEKEDNIGLNEQANYDTSIYLDIIDGIVNDDNINDVKCPYRNKMLNSMYSNLKYNEDKNPVLYYIEQPFDMGQTQKGGKISNKKRTCKKRHCKKIGGYPEQSLSTKSLKKRRNKRKSKTNYTSPYKTI